MPLSVDIPEKEVLRYMGYRGISDIDPETQVRIDKAMEQVAAQSHPRVISKEYPVRIRGNEITVYNDTEEVILASESLARNLKDCCGAILLAATIGPACDMLVRRAAVTSSAEVSIYQATGAAAIEAFLDDYNDKLEKSYAAQGWVPKWLYFVKFEGMSEEDARALTQEAEQANLSKGLFGVE